MEVAVWLCVSLPLGLDVVWDYYPTMLCWFYAMKVGVLLICKVAIHGAYGLL